MKILAFLLLFTSGISACSTQKAESGLPKCIQTKINEYKLSSSCSNAKVDEYIFQGMTVYAFEPGTCGADMTTEIIGSECTRLGYLGGIMGNTKINGEEFSNAKFVKTI